MKPPAPSPADLAAQRSSTSGRRATPASALSRQALVHELQVHQTELEQQNEELRSAQGALASAHDRYVDLFDFAPVGYLTLDREGCITEANLTAAHELGRDRHAMLGSQFLNHVAPTDGDRWQRLKVLALRRAEPARAELRLRRQDGRAFHAQVDCLRVQRAGATVQLRVTLTDVSQRRLAETNRRIAVSSRMAHEAERRRVAHGLHEDLGQRLSALKMGLLELARPAGPAPLQAAADTLATQIDAAVAVVRRMSADLHPLILDNLGLNAALHWLAGDVAARLGLEVELHLDDDALPDDTAAIAIYRLAETVLGELSKHLTAGVSMELLQRPHDRVLQFQCEPGQALPGSPADDPTQAFQPLQDQIHLLSGRLEIDETAQGVRRISIFLPVGGVADP